MEIEVEFIESGTLQGILITDQNEGWFLPCNKSEVEDWVKDNGEEDTDFISEKEWFDEYPEGGHFYTNKTLIEDAWEDQLTEFALVFKARWVQEQEEVHA